MTQIGETEHPDGPWWSRIRRVWWVVAIVAVLVMIGIAVIEKIGEPAPMPYSTFLDQLDAGNVASIMFQGTAIDGRFKHPLDSAIPTGTAQHDSFRSHVPDFGDPALISQLREQGVRIDVGVPSQWASLFARLPWPMLLFIGAGLIAGLVRLVRGGKSDAGSSKSAQPMHGMIGLVSGLFGKQQQADSPPPHRNDEPKSP